MSPIADLRAWRQRQRDRFIARPSNAKHRCADCRVELIASRVRCSICTKRRSRSRQQPTPQE